MSDAREYRPIPAALIAKWQEAACRGLVNPSVLLAAAAGVTHPDGEPIAPARLSTLAALWAQVLQSTSAPMSIVPCPEWRCERPVQQEVLLDGGCPHCGVRVRPLLRFPVLAERVQTQLAQRVIGPFRAFQRELLRLRELQANPWPPKVAPDAEIADVDRFLEDMQRNAERITIAIAGEKNRGKSTIANALLGISYDDSGRFAEAFPSLHVVNTHVAKEVLLPGGRVLDLPGTNSLFEQHDLEAIRRLEDAEAVVLVVMAGSPLLEPEFRFVKECVLRAGSRRIVVALSKVDALHARQWQSEVEEATRYVLYGGDGNAGLLDIVRDRDVRVVPVSCRWYSLADLERVRKRLELRLAQYYPSTTTLKPPAERPRLSWRAFSIQAEIPERVVQPEIADPEEVLSVAQEVLGGACVPSVRRALSSVASPVAVSPAKSALARASIVPALVAAVCLGAAVGLATGEQGVIWGVLSGLVTGAVGLACTKAIVIVRAKRAAASAWRQAASLVCERRVTWINNLCDVGLKALRDAPELKRAGIAELAQAVEDVVAYNAAAAKVFEPLASLRSRLERWSSHVKHALDSLQIALTTGEKRLGALKRSLRQSHEAIEEAAWASLSELARQMQSKAQAIVDDEVKGFFTAIEILWSEEESQPIRMLQERLTREVLNETAIRNWIEKDTAPRIKSAVVEVGKRLEAALDELGETLAQDLRKRGLRVEANTRSLIFGGLTLVGAAALLGGGIAGTIAIPVVIGTSIGGPLGAVVGIIVSLLVSAIAGILPRLIGIKGANSMAKLRNAIKGQLGRHIEEVTIRHVLPKVLEHVGKSVDSMFAQAIQAAENEVQTIRQDVELAEDVRRRLEELFEQVGSCNEKEAFDGSF